MFQYIKNIQYKYIQHRITTITINIMHALLPIFFKESIIRESFATFKHEIITLKKEYSNTPTNLYQNDIKEITFLFLLLTILLSISIYILPPFYEATAITYIIITPPAINLCLMPQENGFIKRMIRQYIMHTPIASIFMIGIQITHTRYPIITAILFFELIQFTLFLWCYQYVLNISDTVHQKYEKIINNMSHHKYVQHIRDTRISITPNPRRTFVQTIILPTYIDIIKKMRYIRTITPIAH